jgi:hypothetical protein
MVDVALEHFEMPARHRPCVTARSHMKGQSGR